ncbi:hypothetical protein TNCV_4538181 [Trichonephila clavipes]|nr:hypothetical protein TNCV_4538181 [Trichonephila clavipes]
MGQMRDSGQALNPLDRCWPEVTLAIDQWRNVYPRNPNRGAAQESGGGSKPFAPNLTLQRSLMFSVTLLV